MYQCAAQMLLTCIPNRPSLFAITVTCTSSSTQRQIQAIGSILCDYITHIITVLFILLYAYLPALIARSEPTQLLKFDLSIIIRLGRSYTYKFIPRLSLNLSYTLILMFIFTVLELSIHVEVRVDRPSS